MRAFQRILWLHFFAESAIDALGPRNFAAIRRLMKLEVKQDRLENKVVVSLTAALHRGQPGSLPDLNILVMSITVIAL